MTMMVVMTRIEDCGDEDREDDGDARDDRGLRSLVLPMVVVVMAWIEDCGDGDDESWGLW